MGRIYLLQSNVSMVALEKVLGGNEELSEMDKEFEIQRRLIGEGSQAKVFQFFGPRK